MCVPQSAPMLLTRNLLYTGITRAKKLLIVISNKNIIEFMIQNTDIKKRNTGLKYKLKNRRKNVLENIDICTKLKYTFDRK